MAENEDQGNDEQKGEMTDDQGHEAAGAEFVPLLEALNIFVLVGFTLEEVFLVIFLLAEMRQAMNCEMQNTYPSRAGQIGYHALQIGNRHRSKLPIIIHRWGSCGVTLRSESAC